MWVTRVTMSRLRHPVRHQHPPGFVQQVTQVTQVTQTNGSFRVLMAARLSFDEHECRAAYRFWTGRSR